MNWLAKKVFDGGEGKDLKNYCKSYGYLHKFLNITKNFIKKIIEELKRKPLNGCTKKYCSPGSMYPGTEKNTARSGSLPSRCLSDRCARNTASRYRLVNEKLTFAAYERKASAACYLGKYSLTAVCRKIAKIVSDAKRKPLNRRTKKILQFRKHVSWYRKNTARSGSLPSRCLSDRCTHNTASRHRLVNEKLTFAAYDRIGGAGPRAQEDPGVGFFKHSLITVCKKIKKGLQVSNCESIGKYSLAAVCRKISKIVSDAKRKPLDRSTLISAAGTSCRGSIILEFAICMPILIILLFYINDLVKIKRYYSQTEFVGQQVANILQNISQKRTNKEIKQNDITNAFCLAFLSIYPGKTMFRIDSKLQFAHTPAMYVYRIKGKNGAASCSWYARVFLDKDYCTDPANVHFSTAPNPTNSGSTIQVVKAGQNKNPADIWPTLKIADGEEKIIIETKIERNPSQYKNMSGQTLSNKQALGFLLLDPKYSKNGQWNQLFHSVVIFTPKPGLFSETAPSQ